MSRQRGAQQQTRRTPQRLSNDGTDRPTNRPTDARPLYRRSSAHYAGSVNNHEFCEQILTAFSFRKISLDFFIIINNSSRKPWRLQFHNSELYFRTRPPSLCSHWRCERNFVLIPTHFYHATTLQLCAFA